MTQPQPLSLAVIGSRRLWQQCEAILDGAGVRGGARTAPLGGAARLLRRYRPAAILLDAVSAPLEALFLLPAIKRLSPASRIVLIGAKPAWTDFILEGLRRGACGHVAVSDLPRYLPRALERVADGQPWVSRRLAAPMVAAVRSTRLRLIAGGAARSSASPRPRPSTLRIVLSHSRRDDRPFPPIDGHGAVR
jgi:DNA-binding NarL/FixJ family response regulator